MHLCEMTDVPDNLRQISIQDILADPTCYTPPPRRIMPAFSFSQIIFLDAQRETACSAEGEETPAVAGAS